MSFQAGSVIMLIIYFSLGFAGPLVPVLRMLYARRRYVKVKAVCVRVDTVFNTDSEGDTYRMYKPYWQYYFGETKYISAMSKGTSSVEIPTGTEKIIYVCPQKPEKIYAVYKNAHICSVILGVLWLSVGMYILYYTVKKIF
ncbi:MAG: hypothetical protein Q4F95_08275 [Oscillospiraceae bacterium]|nr:hypothetical protein [Oscillospiraceae bacterium]